MAKNKSKKNKGILQWALLIIMIVSLLGTPLLLLFSILSGGGTPVSLHG